VGVTDADALVTVGEAEYVLVGDAVTLAERVAEYVAEADVVTVAVTVADLDAE